MNILMGRIISFLVTVALLVSAAFPMASGLLPGEDSGTVEPASEETVCEHNYVAETIYEVTRMTDGIIRHTCTLCGDSYLEFVPAERPIEEAESLAEFLSLYIPDFNYSVNLQEGTVVECGDLSLLVHKADIHVLCEDGRPAAVIDIDADVTLPADTEDPESFAFVGKLYFNGDELYVYAAKDGDEWVKQRFSVSETVMGLLNEAFDTSYTAEEAIDAIHMLAELSEKTASVVSFVENEKELMGILLVGLVNEIRFPSFDTADLIEVTVDDDGNTTYAFKEDGFSATLNAYGARTVAELVNEAYDLDGATKHATDILLDFVKDLPDMTVGELVDGIVVFSEATGISGTDLFLLFNGIGKSITNSDFSLETLLYESGDEKLCTILGYDPEGELTYEEWKTNVWEADYFAKVDEALSLTVAELFDKASSYLGGDAYLFADLVEDFAEFDEMLNAFDVTFDEDGTPVAAHIDVAGTATTYTYTAEDGTLLSVMVTPDAEGETTYEPFEAVYLKKNADGIDFAVRDFESDGEVYDSFTYKQNADGEFELLGYGFIIDNKVVTPYTYFKLSHNLTEGDLLYFGDYDYEEKAEYRVFSLTYKEGVTNAVYDNGWGGRYELQLKETELSLKRYESYIAEDYPGIDTDEVVTGSLEIKGSRTPAASEDEEDTVTLESFDYVTNGVELTYEFNENSDRNKYSVNETEHCHYENGVFTYFENDYYSYRNSEECYALLYKKTDVKYEDGVLTVNKFGATAETDELTATPILDTHAAESILVDITNKHLNYKKYDEYPTKREGKRISYDYDESDFRWFLERELDLTLNSFALTIYDTDYSSCSLSLVDETDPTSGVYESIVLAHSPITACKLTLKDGWLDAIKEANAANEALITAKENGTAEEDAETTSLIGVFFENVEEISYVSYYSARTACDGYQYLVKDESSSLYAGTETYECKESVRLSYTEKDGLLLAYYTDKRMNEKNTDSKPSDKYEGYTLVDHEMEYSYFPFAELTVSPEGEIGAHLFGRSVCNYYDTENGLSTVSKQVCYDYELTADDEGVYTLVCNKATEIGNSSCFYVHEVGRLTYIPGTSLVGDFIFGDLRLFGLRFEGFGFGCDISVSTDEDGNKVLNPGSVTFIMSDLSEFAENDATSYRYTLSFDFTTTPGVYKLVFAEGMFINGTEIPGYFSFSLFGVLDMNKNTVEIYDEDSGYRHTYGKITWEKKPEDAGWKVIVEDSELIQLLLEFLSPSEKDYFIGNGWENGGLDGFFTTYGIDLTVDPETGSKHYDCFLDLCYEIEGRNDFGCESVGTAVDSYRVCVDCDAERFAVSCDLCGDTYSDLVYLSTIIDYVGGDPDDENGDPGKLRAGFYLNEQLSEILPFPSLALSVLLNEIDSGYIVSATTPFFDGFVFLEMNDDGEPVVRFSNGSTEYVVTLLANGGIRVEAVGAYDGETYLTFELAAVNGHLDLVAFIDSLINVGVNCIPDLHSGEPMPTFADVFGDISFTDAVEE